MLIALNLRYFNQKINIKLEYIVYVGKYICISSFHCSRNGGELYKQFYTYVKEFLWFSELY